MRVFFIFIILFIGNATAFGQCEEVYLKGRVVDTTFSQSFYNLMVINQTTKQGVYGRPNGEFAVYARRGDRIGFSVKGYTKEFIVIPDVSNCTFDTIIYLQTRLQEYDEITVYPIKSLEQIKKEREEISRRETRTVTGIDAFKSPITFLYERFSKRAQSKQFVAKMEHQDNMNEIVKELLRAYVSYDVVYLEDEEFTDFINFLNIDEHFLKTATDYELIIYIQGKLEHYKVMHPEIFER